MPYSIVQDGEEYCLVKTGTGEQVACHDTRSGAERQRRAILANEYKESSRQDNELRMALLVTSNAYQDGDGDIIKQAALEHYVERCWKESEYVNRQSLLYWHGGDPIGEIIFADTWGPFLIEVARELPDAEINLARDWEEPYYGRIRKMWDAMDYEPDWGTSHEFWHPLWSGQGGIYDLISIKTESSILPVRAAANKFTLAAVVR